jgi:hypothetical protein
MKLKQPMTSTQQQTSDIPREDRRTAVMYVQPDGTALYAVSPKPPTPEAVEKAKFIDKTYVWLTPERK